MLKKMLSVVFALLLLVGCSREIATGVYTVENSNDMPLYLIDIDTGYRLAELDPSVFEISIGEDKMVASFDVDYYNQTTNKYDKVEYGFFNGTLKESNSTVINDINESENLIIIKPDAILRNSSEETIGKALRNIGPIKYNKFEDNYYYFVLANNIVKVLADSVIVVEPSDNTDTGDNDWSTIDVDYGGIAYDYLSDEYKAIILDSSIYVINVIAPTSKGVSMINPERNGTVNVINTEIISVTFTSVSEGQSEQIVYIDSTSYGLLGFSGEITEVTEPETDTDNTEDNQDTNTDTDTNTENPETENQ